MKTCHIFSLMASCAIKLSSRHEHNKFLALKVRDPGLVTQSCNEPNSLFTSTTKLLICISTYALETIQELAK